MESINDQMQEFLVEQAFAYTEQPVLVCEQNAAGVVGSTIPIVLS